VCPCCSRLTGFQLLPQPIPLLLLLLLLLRLLLLQEQLLLLLLRLSPDQLALFEQAWRLPSTVLSCR
jgi:hypothetical protein